MTTTNFKTPEVLLMMDIESLDVGPRSVVTQVGLVAVPAVDPETILGVISIHLPIEPQLTLKRTISAKTLIWWMQQSDKARSEFALNDSDDFEELPSLLRHLNRKITQFVDGREYELYARGPQFDVVNVESLMKDLSIKPAWEYGRVRDLRTVMAMAGLSSKDIPRDTEAYPEHVAVADCKFQLFCLTEAFRHVRARS